MEVLSSPPFGTPLDAVVFRDFLRDEAGSFDMTVLASPTSPVTFRVKAVEGVDVYVKSLAIRIAGTSITLGDFGEIAALTNPCIFLYQTEIDTVVLSNDITTNFDLMALGGELMPGVGGTVADALKVGAPGQGMTTLDTYVAFIDFARIFGLPFGIRLAAGSEQTIAMIIQDDLTGVDTFTCDVLGQIRGPDTERA